MSFFSSFLDVIRMSMARVSVLTLLHSSILRFFVQRMIETTSNLEMINIFHLWSLFNHPSVNAFIFLFFFSCNPILGVAEKIRSSWGIGNVRFLENVAYFVFLKHPF